MAQSAMWFAVMSLLVKLAGATMPLMQVVFGRGLVTLLLSSLLLWRAGLWPLGTRTGLLLMRGVFGSTALICFYAAIVHLPLAEATVIQQTSPLFTALLAAWLLRERLEPRVLGAIATCLVGVLLIAQPVWLFGGERAVELDWRFVAVGLTAAVLSAFAYVTVRSLGRTEHALVVVFWFPVVTVTISAPFAVTQWVWPDAIGWLLLGSIGTVTQLGQMALTHGLSRATAARATTMGYLQIAIATVLGAIVFGVHPDLPSCIGIALIVISLLGTARPKRT
ncbi:MAG: DMT family transporter [Planctomycetes bacterium]|nr:DMT family transporter [Planctomycetota bacterium]